MSKKQSLRFRLIVYPLLGALFAVFAYFIALSAMGYQISLKNGQLQKERTGAIIVATRPGDAMIYLNGRKVDSNTPRFPFLTTQLGGLKPGNYNLRLVKKDYETWDGVARVYSGMVTWGTQILLLPQKRTASPYNLSASVESQLVSPDGTRMVVVTKDPENQSIAVYQINLASKVKTALFEKRISATDTYRPIQYSAQNQRLLFELTQGTKKSYLVYETSSNPTSWNITDSFKLDYDGFLFNPKNPDELIVTRSGNLFRLNYQTKVVSAALYSNVLGLYLENQNIIFVQKNDKYISLYRLNTDNKADLVIRDLPASDGYTVRFLNADLGYVVLPSKTKSLLLYRPNGNPDVKAKAIAENVDYFLPSSKFQFIGYAQNGGFYCYQIDKERYFTTFENRKISSIYWFNDQYNLTYTENGKLKMITFNGHYDKEVFNVTDKYPVVAGPDGPKLYFVSENIQKKVFDLNVFEYPTF